VEAVIIFLLTIVAGVGAYWLRCKHLFIYGIVELFAALVIIFVTAFPQGNALLMAEQPWWGGWFKDAAGLFAGAYVMVRSFDNIDRGWPKGFWPAARSMVTRAFPRDR
jgi:hypothetical protein